MRSSLCRMPFAAWRRSKMNATFSINSWNIMLTRFCIHCYSTRRASSPRQRKIEPQQSMKDTGEFYVVRKGDLIGVYKSFSDCQKQLSVSVCDPGVSVYKGHCLQNDTKAYLASHGLKDAIYTINAADVKDDLFGTLIPCPFQSRYYDMILSTKLAGLGHAAFLFMSTARDRVSYVYPNVNAAGAGLMLSETFTSPSMNLSEGGYNMYHQMIDWLGRPARNVPREPVPPLKVSISKKLREFVEAKYKQAGAEKGKYIVIHGIQSDSIASMQSKGDKDSLLSIQIWAEITKGLGDVRPVFVIPHEKEREDVEEVVGEDSSIMFITTPGQLAALINDSIGIICTNTAALQLANAREKQSIALFSSDEKGRLFVPNAEEKRCVIISSKTGKLADIDVDTVKTAAQQVFAGSLVLA